MSGQAQRAPTQEALRLAAALREADSALVCLQAGCAQQAAAHVSRGEASLAGEREMLKDAGMEQALGEAKTAGSPSAARRRLARLTRALARHPGRPAGTPRAWPDHLDRRGRIIALAGAALFMIGALLLRPGQGPAEERSVVGILPPAKKANIKLTEAELKARFADGHFNHLSRGFTFGERAEVRLAKTTPVYVLDIGLRNAMIHRVTLLHRGVARHSFVLGPRAIPVGLMNFHVILKGTTTTEGVDTIVIQGLDGDGAFELGPIKIMDWQ